MITTLNRIREFGPCQPSWKKLLKSLGKTEADDEPIDLIYILDTLGIQDATWCLQCFDYKDYCLFSADVAESVLPIFESVYPDDSRVRDRINSIRDYHAGKIPKSEISAAAVDAVDAADAAAYAVDAADAAAYAADAAYAAAHAADAAYRASYAARCASYAARCAAYSAAYYAARAAAALDNQNKWAEVEQLFRKHFA